MGLIDDFAGKVVGFDTNPFIYYLEEHEKYIAFLDLLFEANRDGTFLIVTSTVTLLEVLVVPLKKKKEDLIQNYRDILEHSPSIKLIHMRPEVAVLAAELRPKYSVRTPDSVQLAAAIFGGAEYFLTNDKKLKSVEELKVLLLDEQSHRE